MGAQQREYKKRIRSAQGMQKIFKAQEMIAAARIAKAHARVTATTPYAEALTRAIGSVATHSSEASHPFLEQDRTSSKKAGILLITADRGMAGSYSPNAIREAEHLANSLWDDGITPVRFIVGRKGDSYFRFRNRSVEKSWTPYREEDIPKLGLEIADELNRRLLTDDPEEHLDQFYVVGTRFTSRFQQQARASRLVPLGLVDSAPDQAKETFPLYEFIPDAETALEDLVPRYIQARIINILLQSMASEHAARQRAMKTATDNADQQITKFTRLANAARQAEITQEITEIVGGADALAGSGRADR
ncbi:F0F1 ATP synthase subunit gamma [Brachybacterium huguangmaarense]